jgi:hypothetical protein
MNEADLYLLEIMEWLYKRDKEREKAAAKTNK